jgi:hypothetical protein
MPLSLLKLARAKPYRLYYRWRLYTDLYASYIQNVELKHSPTSLFPYSVTGTQINQCEAKTTLCVFLGSLIRADRGEGGGPLPRRPGQDRSSHRQDRQTNHVTFRQIT